MVCDLQHSSQYTSELSNLSPAKVIGPLMISMDELQGIHEAPEIPGKCVCLCIYIFLGGGSISFIRFMIYKW